MRSVVRVQRVAVSPDSRAEAQALFALLDARVTAERVHVTQ